MANDSPSHDVRLANGEEDLRRAFPVMAQLRTHLSEAEFVKRATRQAESGGYRVALLEQDGRVRAVAGFRITETLFSGRHLYVDDLVTDAASRSAGFGARLLTWLTDHARREGCAMIELDSGLQRIDAHRFYYREGMHISSFRFRRKLTE